MKQVFYTIASIPVLLILVWMLWMSMRDLAMKRRQQGLIAQLQGQRYWRINLARPSFFARWRPFPFEAKGVLIDQGDWYRLQGHWGKSGAAFDSSMPKASATLKWLGSDSLKTSNLHWVRIETPKGQVMLSADTGLYPRSSACQALCDMLHSAFPDFALTEDDKAPDFALEKNPRSLCATVLILGLLLFALLDSYVISKYELVQEQLLVILTTPQVLLGLPLGLITLIAVCYRFFLAGRVPARESLLLAAMLCLIGAGATFPVLKRIDQLLAQTPAQTYSYRLSGASDLEPVNPALGLPRLQFPRMKEYWQQLPPGSQYPVPLLRGPIGLWQLDHAQFDPPIIAFYEKQRARR